MYIKVVELISTSKTLIIMNKVIILIVGNSKVQDPTVSTLNKYLIVREKLPIILQLVHFDGHLKF